MSTSLKLSVLSPERRLVENVVVEEVTLPGTEGQIQVLPGHAPMIGSLETGAFSFKLAGGQETKGVISTGFFQVKDDQLTIMAETLELRTEIDLSRAKRAQEIAEQVLREADLDEHRFKKYQLKLQRALIRQQVAS